MTEKIAQQNTVERPANAVVVPWEVVEDPAGKDGRKGLKEACAAIAEYVKSELHLTKMEDDSSTPVYYWESEWWNKPSSMVGDNKGGWNGGFRTHVGYALTGKTKDEVKNAKGTGFATAADNGNGENADGTPKQRKQRIATTGPAKLLVQFEPEIEKGIAYLDFGNNGDVTFSAEDQTVIAALTTQSTWGRQIQLFASNPREALRTASELDQDGNVVQPGWAYKGDGDKSYTSIKNDRSEAAQDIVNKIVAALDLPNVKNIEKILTDPQAIVSTGEGIKDQWIDRWLPKPEPKPVEQPAAPSEVPMTKEQEQAAYLEGKMADAVSAEKNGETKVAEQPKVEEPAKAEEQPTPVEIPQPEMAEAEVAPAAPAKPQTPAQRARARIVNKR
jgi:hypothetical protein